MSTVYPKGGQSLEAGKMLTVGIVKLENPQISFSKGVFLSEHHEMRPVPQAI
jgi:hypothetical protein